MRTFLIKKDSKGNFQFSENEFWGWNYFPDSVRTQKQMLDFFQRGGHNGLQQRFDEPLLRFVDSQNRAIVHYSVTRKGDLVYAKINNDRDLIFLDNDFMDLKAQYDFLKGHSDPDKIEKAESLANDLERFNYLFTYVENDIKDKLKETIQKTKTDDKIRELCQGHATKYHNAPAVVEFKE